LSQISAIRKILRARETGLRDEALFVLGINSAFRIGDLLRLTVGDVVTKGKLKKRLVMREQKTKKNRQIALNDAASKVLENFLRSRGPIKNLSLSDPLFPSSTSPDHTICRQRFHQILKEAATELGLDSFSAHSLRKTFGFHVYKASGNNIALVQKLLNHSSSSVTLRYIGVDQEDMDDACLNLNLY
jgi:integrase